MVKVHMYDADWHFKLVFNPLPTNDVTCITRIWISALWSHLILWLMMDTGRVTFGGRDKGYEWLGVSCNSHVIW